MSNASRSSRVSPQAWSISGQLRPNFGRIRPKSSRTRPNFGRLRPSSIPKVMRAHAGALAPVGLGLPPCRRRHGLRSGRPRAAAMRGAARPWRGGSGVERSREGAPPLPPLPQARDAQVVGRRGYTDSRPRALAGGGGAGLRAGMVYSALRTHVSRVCPWGSVLSRHRPAESSSRVEIDRNIHLYVCRSRYGALSAYFYNL